MNILFVDDEIQVLRGMCRMIECEMEDWFVETATSGSQALEILSLGEFNAIVSDMTMPEMDGAQLLKAVETQYPNVLRVVLSGQADQETVLRAMGPMHQFLSKPCDPEDLLNVIRRAEVFQQTISSSDVLDAIGRANCLPSLPKVVNEINEELTKEKSTAKTLSEIISQDAVLTAKILQMANSAIFGLKNPVVDLERALTVLGSDIIRSVAISLSVFSPDTGPTANLATELFHHCLDVSGTCREIAAWEEVSPEETNIALSAGLLHDIGKVVLLNAFAERYTETVARATPDEPDWRLEYDEFGATHSGVGAYLMKLWGLPEILVEAVAAHHNPEICSRSSMSCKIVFAANWIAGGADMSVLKVDDPTKDTKVFKEFVAQLAAWNKRYMADSEKEMLTNV